MSEFRSRWADFEPQMTKNAGAKSDKSPSVTFGTSIPGRFGPAEVPTALGAPCLTCGATPEELAAVRARRALAEAFDRWDEHAHACTAGCTPAKMDRCPEGERLAGAYFDTWARWLAATGEGASDRG